MEFDENKKIEVEISENQFVENRVGEAKSEKRSRRSSRKSGLDGWDIAIIPVALGVFMSLGFLFANLFRATAAVDALSGISEFFTNLF